jgi:hypothetical protein
MREEPTPFLATYDEEVQVPVDGVAARLAASGPDMASLDVLPAVGVGGRWRGEQQGKIKGRIQGGDIGLIRLGERGILKASLRIH